MTGLANRVIVIGLVTALAGFVLAAWPRVKVAFNPEFIIRRLLSIRSADDLQFIWRGVKYIWGHLTDFNPRLNKKIKAQEQVATTV